MRELSQILGFGPKRLEALEKRGIRTALELVERLPTGYRDTTCPLSPAQLTEGLTACVEGVVTGARIHGDFFSAADVTELEQRLIGLRHEPAAMAEALRDAPWTTWFSGCDPERVRDFFLQS